MQFLRKPAAIIALFTSASL